jgi:uncharacterized protein YdaU (DUF1376 family)
MSDPWFKFYPSDWLAGTRGLTMAEAGLYVTLTAMMYERAEPISMDHGRLARLCGASPAAFKKALSALIDEGKIIQTDAGLWSKRVQKELKNREQKRDLATQSAAARWEKTQQNQSKADANASKTQCESDATRSQKPEARDKKRNTTCSQKKRTPASRLPEGWEPDPELLRWAADELKATRAGLQHETGKFVDYWLAQTGAKALKADWRATWRNWMRRASEEGKLKPALAARKFNQNAALGWSS